MLRPLVLPLPPFNMIVTIAGSVQFINNSANLQGGAIHTDVNVTIAVNAQVLFQGNHAKTLGGAISSSQHVAIAGLVQFINNSVNNGSGGAIVSNGNVTVADTAQAVFQGNLICMSKILVVPLSPVTMLLYQDQCRLSTTVPNREVPFIRWPRRAMTLPYLNTSILDRFHFHS